MVERLRFEQWGDPAFPLVAMAAAGGSFQPHCHDFHELVFVRRGGGVHLIGEQPYPMLRGDFYLMTPDDVHGYEVDGELGIVNLLFRPDLFSTTEWQDILALPGLRPYLQQGGRGAPHKLALSPGHAARMEELCCELVGDCRDRPPGWQLSARALFTQVLVLVSRASAAYGLDRRHEQLPPGPIADAIALIHGRLDEDLRVAELAATVGLSPNWFGERFRIETGIAVLDYIAKLRVDRARCLLEQGRHTITAIALAVGYQDPSYFARVFRRQTGMSPRRYGQLAA